MFGKTDQKRSEGEDTVLPRARGGLIAAIVGGFLLFMAGGATALLLGPGDWKSRRDGVVNPDAFTDGIGIYLLNDGKYNLLVWQKKIVAALGTAPDPKDIAEASREAIAVGPGARFFNLWLGRRDVACGSSLRNGVLHRSRRKDDRRHLSNPVEAPRSGARTDL